MIKALEKCSILPFLRAVAFDWGVILASMFMAARLHSWLGYLAAGFLIGNRQHALGLLGHELSHGLGWKDRKWAYRFANLFCLWPLGINVEGYSDFHFRHHLNLGTEQDPEVPGKRAHWIGLPSGRPKLVLILLTDLLGLGVHDMASTALATRSRKLYPTANLLMFLVGAVGLALWTGQTWLLALWAGSMATFFWAIFRLRMYSEHPISEQTIRFHANPVLRFVFFPHNTYCHYEHHRWPNVPFYNLPKARAYDRSRPVLSFKQMLDFVEASSRIPPG